MERGILFSEYNKKPMAESQNSFCFADVIENTLWDVDEHPEISHEQAVQLDAIGQSIILKQF